MPSGEAGLGGSPPARRPAILPAGCPEAAGMQGTGRSCVPRGAIPIRGMHGRPGHGQAGQRRLGAAQPRQRRVLAEPRRELAHSGHFFINVGGTGPRHQARRHGGRPRERSVAGPRRIPPAVAVPFVGPLADALPKALVGKPALLWEIHHALFDHVRGHAVFPAPALPARQAVDALVVEPATQSRTLPSLMLKNLADFCTDSSLAIFTT